jgi:methionine-rich copper-binding protein CopC
MVTAWLAALALLLAPALLAAPAAAQPELVESEPAHGDILTEPPEPIHMCFSEPVVIGANNFRFSVKTPNGEPMGLRTVFADGGLCADVYVGIPQSAPKGRWTVDWTVRSVADESEASGSFSFQFVDEDSPSVVPSKSKDDDGLDVVLIVVVGFGVAAAVVILGGAAGALLRRRSRPPGGGDPD